MGAIVVSTRDEHRSEELGRRLGIRCKAGVVRLAVDELERIVSRREMTSAIGEYVRRHGRLERAENSSLGAGGVARDGE